jgi:tetrahydromethanopterin S-methyltransferase subunit B
MAALFVLDSEWLMKIFRDHETKYLYKLFSVIHTFSNFHFSYVMYPFLRIFYEKMIEHKKIGEAEISQIAKAYLINMETLDNKENLMSKIIRTENQSDIAHLAESICDTYDQWGHEKWMWKKVRSYWENRVSEWDGKHSEEMAAFARVFEESRRGISEDEDSIKLHIPECFEMLYKLLKPLCYSMPNTSYSSRERISAVVGYLSNECHGFEEITIELFALCIGYDSENYDKYEVESRPGIKILETCLAKGGDARKKAIEIIEKHETRGNQSLSYLISNYDI